MASEKHPILIESFDEEQKHRICLADESGKHFFCLSRILYAKADRCYTTFYLTGTAQATIVTSRNLGFYAELLDYGFGQANQSIIFNLDYLSSISPSHEIELSIQPHELIQVTPTYREALYERLRLIP